MGLMSDKEMMKKMMEVEENVNSLMLMFVGSHKECDLYEKLNAAKLALLSSRLQMRNGGK